MSHFMAKMYKSVSSGGLCKPRGSKNQGNCVAGLPLGVG